MKKGAVFWAYFVVFLANAAPFYAFDFYGYIFYGNWTEAEGINITAKVYDSSGNPSIKISEHSSATDAEGWFNISGIPGPEPDYTYKAVLAAPWLFHISEEDYPAVSLSPEEMDALAGLMPLEILLEGDDFWISGPSICKGPEKDPRCHINVTNMSAVPIKGRSNSYFYVTANVADQLDTPTVKVNNVLMSLVSGTFYAVNSTGTDLKCRKEGKCELSFSAKDRLGNKNDSEMIEITIDNEPPLLENPSKSHAVAKSSSNVQINVTATDSSNITGVYVNNISMSNIEGDIYTATANSSVLGCMSEGDCTLLFSATDELGNENSGLEDTLVIDDTPPEVNEYCVGISVARSDANFMISAQLKDSTEVASAKVNSIEMVRAGAGNEYILDTNGSALGCAEGLCPLHLNATDIAGNSNDSEVLHVMIDDTAPSVSNTSINVTRAKSSSHVVISASVNDNNLESVTINGTALSNTSHSEWSITGALSDIFGILSEGKHSFEFIATDLAGNVNNSAGINFLIDDTKPSFVSVSSSLNSSAAIISWVTDENASARVEYWTGQSNSSYVNLANLSSPGSIIISPILAAATYYYNISACDEAGNCNTSGVYNFTVPGPIQKPKSGRKNHKISIKDGMKKTIISMKPSEKVIFRIDGETHTLTVGGYSDLFANITIFSEPKNYTLEVNKSLAIDVDQDNSYDLLAKYQGIFSRRLKIMFDYINYTIENDSNKEEPLPELQPIREDAVEQPAQEQPSPASVWPENRNPVFSAVSKNEGKSVFVIACTMAAVLVLIVFAGMFLSDRII